MHIKKSCKFWQLKVNVEKTKILVFSRGGLPNNLTFTFNEMEIGIVSDFFRCENCVRQGENLYPFLFSIFLNDLESYLQSKDVSGLTTLSEEIENQLNVYLKLFELNKNSIGLDL